MLHRIEVNIGRTGAATPFAMLEPTVVAGSTISMATLHNPDDIIRKDIRPGELVIIEKAGDVIPRVVGPVNSDPDRPHARAWVMPTACPVCGSDAAEGRRRSGVALREQLLPVEAAARPRALRVARRDEHRGPGRVAGRPAVARRAWSRATPTSTRLTPATLEGLERMGKKSAAKVLSEIEKSQGNDVWRLIYGLGIRHVGERGAQVLADHFGSIDDDRSARRSKSCSRCREIGPVLAASVRTWFDEPRNRELIERLRAGRPETDGRAQGRARRPAAARRQDLRDHRRRSAACRARRPQAKLEALGAKVTGSVSKKTTALIVGPEPGPASRESTRTGRQTLDEAGLLDLLELLRQ